MSSDEQLGDLGKPSRQLQGYTFIRQEQKEFCVPACIQMVLGRRGISFDRQEKIASELGKHIEKPGAIMSYFQNRGISLHCTEFFFNQCLDRDFDLLGREALDQGVDVMVGYAWDVLYSSQGVNNHTALLGSIEFKPPQAIAWLVDPARSEPGVVYCDFWRLASAARAIHGGGYYLIHPQKQVLERLMERFS